MRENDSFYDIFLIFHPADSDKVGRIAEQIRATGFSALFNEDEFGRTADAIRELKASLLRSYTVAFALSTDSAESQLCNELLQYAVSKGKRLATLILDDDIEVEVHPSIAQNPYVFFREGDDLASRVDELNAYLRVDANLKLHTELLSLAEAWRERGRPPDLLLPPDRLDEARGWLATAPARHPKPSALQLEYVHSSRRQPPRRARTRPLPIAAGIALAVAICLGLILLLRAVSGWGSGQAADELTSEARAANAAAESTAASDSAVGLIDQVAATGAVVRTGVAQNATVESITATAAARVTQTAQARSDTRATQMRATEIADLERDDVARHLVEAGEAALAQGNTELALALAWEAKDGLDDPRSAYRLLRGAAASRRAMTIDDAALLGLHPAGDGFALVAQDRDALHIYDSESWLRRATRADHEGKITALVYSVNGERLITAADDGEIIVRDGASGAPQKRLNKHQGAVTALALSPDGRLLISAASDPQLVAWDIVSGEALAVSAAAEEKDLKIQQLLVSADGERVIGWTNSGGRPLMAQWRGDTLELLSADSGGRVYSGVDAQGRIGYSGGSSLPAYPGDSNAGDLILWDLSTGEQRARLTDGFNWSFLSGDGLAAATDDLQFVAFYEELALVVVENSVTGRRANLVDTEDGRLLRRFEGELASLLTSAAWLDGQTILSATSDKRILLWSGSDGRLIREIGRAPAGIQSLQVNALADLVIAVTEDGASLVWRLEAAAAPTPLSLSDALPGTSISPSGANLLIVEEGSLSLRAVDSGETLVQLPAASVGIAGDRFAAYADARLQVYDFETGAAIRSWDWAEGELANLYPAPGGDRLLAVSESNELWLFQGDAAAPLRLEGDTPPPAFVRFAPTGDTILTMQGELARLWDGEIGLERAAYPLGARERVDLQAAFSADGESLLFYLQLEESLAGLTTVRLADNEARRMTFVDVKAAALAADGESLALVYNDGRIEVVASENGAVLRQIDAGARDVVALQYLPESDTLATAAGSELILWDGAAGVEDQHFAHTRPLVGFSISHDGQRIATADESGAFWLWQVESAEALLARIADRHRPRELTCSERERYLVAPLCV